MAKEKLDQEMLEDKKPAASEGEGQDRATHEGEEQEQNEKALEKKKPEAPKPKAAKPSKAQVTMATIQKVMIKKALVNMSCHDGTHMVKGKPCEIGINEYKRLKADPRHQRSPFFEE